MKRLLASALIVAGLFFVGCEKKDDSAKDVNQAANKTADQAADSLNKAKANVDKGVDQAQDAAKDAGKAQANMMEGVEKQIDDMINKAKDAVKDKKWSDAENYIAQAKPMIAKLPQASQDRINASLADVQKMIDAGKQLTPGR
jgi:DNA anti-recombination protein RmuC